MRWSTRPPASLSGPRQSNDPVPFPYITSYLTFRELPLLAELIEEVRAQGRLAAVVLVDGTGVLHPRRAGIATNLGVVTGLADHRRDEEAALRPG